MSLEPLCPECGTALPEGDLGNRCPSCLLRLALGEAAKAPREDSEFEDEVGAEPAVSPVPANRVGDYEILGEIARGGMGVVYKARQRSLDRIVALKRIASQKLATPEMLLRFQMETEAIAKLDHPNIVPLYETGEHEGVQFFTMKLVEGGNLADRIDRLKGNGNSKPSAQRFGFNGKSSNRRRRHAEELVVLLSKVCRSVHHAHQRGILHRDLKPANILIDESGEPHVSDFGLAKLLEKDSGVTRTESILGSPNYMAPEQAGANGKPVTIAADVYSLGAILYEILTTEPPFKAGTPLETMRRVVEEEPRRPSTLMPGVDPDLETVCLRCLEKEPARRYASADDLSEDLERWLKGEPILARPIPVWAQALRWARRNPAIAGAGVLAVSCLAALAVGSTLAAARIAAAKEDTEVLLARSQMREADRLFEVARSSDGLALLAHVTRKRPGDPDVARRLASALSHRRFPEPVHPPMAHDSMILDAVVRAEKQWIQSVTASGTIHRRSLADGERILPPIPLGGSLLDARFSKNGEHVALVTHDHRVELWRVAAVAERIRDFDRATIPDAGRVALSSDGSRIAACRKHASTIHIFNAKDGKLIRTLGQPDRITGRFCLSDDGNRLGVGLANGSVLVWDVESGESLAHESAHDRYIMAVAFSPDGRFVASASNDRTARIWDLKTGKALPWVARHWTEVTSVSFSSEGKWLITGSLDFSTRLWDMASGRLVCDPLGHQVAVIGIAESSSSEIIGTFTFNEMRVWHPREAHGAPFEMALSDGYVALAFGPTGDHIATGEANGRVRVWNVRNRDSSEGDMNYSFPVNAVAFHPDERSLAVATHGAGGALLGLQSDEFIHLHSDDWVEYVEFDASGSRLITASHDHTARVWDTTTGGILGPALRHEDAVISAAISSDGKWALTASRDTTAGVWSVETAERLARLPHYSMVVVAKFSPSDRLVATGSYDYRARLWPFDPETGTVDEKQCLVLPHKGEVTWLDFSPDGRWVATASFDQTARVWNVATGESRPYRLRHDAPVTRVSFSPDGILVVTASEDHTARVWSVATGQPVTEPLQHSESVCHALFSPDGLSVATASEDGMVKIWPLPRVGVGDSDWLCDLAEWVSRQTVDAGGCILALDDDSLGSRRSRLGSSESPSSLVRWFLHPKTGFHEAQVNQRDRR